MKYTKLKQTNDFDDDDNVTLMTTTTTTTNEEEEKEDSYYDENDNDDIGDVELISSSSSSSSIIATKKTTTTKANNMEENDEQQFIKHDDDRQEEIQLQQLQLWRLSNLAIPLCYLMVGLTQGLVYPLINVYPLDLGASEAQQQTIWFLKGLPSCLKIVFGFLSDNYPIFGLRRKPYMYIGWCISMISLLGLLLTSNLSLSTTIIQTTITTTNTIDDDKNNYDDCIDIDELSINDIDVDVIINYNNNTITTSCFKEIRVPPTSYSSDGTTSTLQQQQQSPPSIQLLSLVCFLWAVGVWLADVIGDSLVAEKAKYETNENRGNLQASCYLLRGLGIALMAPISTLLYNNPNGPFWIVFIATILPLGLMPFIYQLKENRVIIVAGGGGGGGTGSEQEDVGNDGGGDGNNQTITTIPSTKENLYQLWKTACSKAVYQPIGFVYLYVALYVSNAAWKEFLKSVLGFTPNQLNALLFAAGFLAFVGLVVYKFFLLKWSWRTVFLMGIILNGIFSLAQILLITDNIPFGLNAFWFSLGDDGVKDFVIGTQYLPMCVMMVNLVPTGIEGMSYALFTTTWNSAQAVSDSLSTILLSIWDVSKQTMIVGELNGLIKLTILTTVLQITPLLFIKLMPHSVDDINKLKQHDQSSSSSSSTIGGYIYLSIVFISVVFAIFIGVMNIIQPGWMGES